MIMVKIEKRVGTMAVAVVISNRKNNISVNGEVHPFVDRFHCARFNIMSRRGCLEATVGCGGSSFSLSESSRIIQATQVAHDVASYYVEVGETLATKAGRGKDYVHVMQRLIESEDTEAVLDALLMTPSNVDADQVEKVLELLDANSHHLGVKDGVRAALSESFYDIPPVSLDALFTLIEHHPEYKLQGNDMAASAVDLVDVLSIGGIVK